MIKKTMVYTDYDGNERTEDFCFNLSKAEVAEMELSTAGGVTRMIERLVQEQDSKRIVEIFKDLICRAYGVKSPDGKRFIKSKELTEAFMQTEAYSDLFMALMGDPDMAAAFFNEVLPKVEAPADKAGAPSSPVKFPTPANIE